MTVSGLTATGFTVGLLTGCSEDGVQLPGLRQEEDPDTAVVRKALQIERDALVALQRARKKYARLAPVAQPTLRVHRAHVRVLRDAVPEVPAGRGRQSPGSLQRTLEALVAQERRTHRAHTRLALEARSGDLARVLASMAAAALQQAEVLGRVDLKQAS